MDPTSTTLSSVIQLIWTEGEISRAEVARRCDLSRSTVSALVQQLIDLGAVREARVGPSQGGRPPVMLRFEHDRYRMIGLDIGATHVTAIVMDPRGRVLSRATAPHAVERDPTGTLRLVDELLTHIHTQAGIAPGQLLGIGVAVPCPVHPAAPGRLSPSILPAWKGIDLAAILTERWGVPTYLENDANLGALGELYWGQGRRAGDFTYVKLATGVGAGLIIDGDIYRGGQGIAGEIGHTAIDGDGPPCRCGLFGCLETMIGSGAIEARYRELRKQLGEPMGSDTPDLGRIAAAAAAGDPTAVLVIDRAGRHLGAAIANLLNIINPSRIVLSGRLTLAGAALLDPLRQTIAARAMWTNVAAADVVISTLGDDAIPLGAATLVLRTALADPTRLATGLPDTVPRRKSVGMGGPEPTP